MFADHVIPFVFESLPVRGELIHFSRSWQRMIREQDYAPVVRETLGHAAAATGLIAQSLKFQGAITLQIHGDGDLRMLVMQCTSDLELRGMASTATDLTAESFAELLHRAHCAITIDSGERPYQGIVEVDRRSLAASLERYFERSVQVPSHVVLLANDNLCAGLLLQQMPGRAIDADDWRRLGFLSDTLGPGDFDDTDDGVELIGKLYAEDDVRVFAGKPVTFRCRCSRARAAEVLRMLGEPEVRDVLAEQGKVEINCEYCGRKRRFDAVDVSGLFAENVAPGPDRVQ